VAESAEETGQLPCQNRTKIYRRSAKVQADHFFTTTGFGENRTRHPSQRIKNREADRTKKFSGGWVRNLG
jgi:hypothetical protein